MTRPRGVLVLGMHRSGTSAVTGALVDLGLEPGTGDLMAAMDSNPTGHWEVERLTAFDDEVLRALGGRWSGPPVDDPEAVAALAHGALGAEARGHLDALFEAPSAPGGPGAGSWVWKDPRACLLVPFWRQVLVDEPPVALVVTRHPAAVAASLEARDGFAPAYGAGLWERYTRVALRDLAGLPTLVVGYDDLVADPGRLGEVADALAGFDVGVDPDRLGGAARRFDAAHRHQRATEDEVLTPGQRELWAVLGSVAGTHAAFVPPDLPDESPGLQVAFSEHARMGAWEELADAHEETIALREREIADLRAEMAARGEEAQARIDELAAVAEEREQRLLDLYDQAPVRAWLALRRRLGGR